MIKLVEDVEFCTNSLEKYLVSYLQYLTFCGNGLSNYETINKSAAIHTYLLVIGYQAKIDSAILNYLY